MRETARIERHDRMNQQQLQITHLVENLERGGLERVVIDLALEQAAQGLHVQVICLFNEGLLARELITAGIPVIACNKGQGFDWRAVGKIRVLLRNHKTQILHSHNPIPNYYGVLASIFINGLTVVNTRHGMGNAPFHVRRELLYRVSLIRTAFVAMVCESARQNFVRHRIVVRAKAKVIPNGIRMNLFCRYSARAHEILMAMLKSRTDVLCIGTVGRLNPVKDQASLLHAMVHIRETINDAILVIVGGGALQHELEDLARSLGIANAVHFLGDRDDVKILLPGFDIFVLPSLSEGYSISLLEACACGLPIVATDVGGNGEIVRSGVNGLLVEPKNVEEIANAVIKLARSRDLRSEMGWRGHEWVAANGTTEVMAQRYMALYLGELT